MAQQVQCLLSQLEGLSSDPKNPMAVQEQFSEARELGSKGPEREVREGSLEVVTPHNLKDKSKLLLQASVSPAVKQGKESACICLYRAPGREGQA